MATWNGRISPVFEVARFLELFDLEAGAVVARHEATLPGTDPLSQTARLAEAGADLLICGAVSRAMAAALEARKIRFVPFVSGPAEQVLAAWIAGGLAAPEWCMPGCRRRGRPGRGRRGRRRGRGWSTEGGEWQQPESGENQDEGKTS